MIMLSQAAILMDNWKPCIHYNIPDPRPGRIGIPFSFILISISCKRGINTYFKTLFQIVLITQSQILLSLLSIFYLLIERSFHAPLLYWGHKSSCLHMRSDGGFQIMHLSRKSKCWSKYVEFEWPKRNLLDCLILPYIL
jgi:hypothetical protein